jgi:4'-phosphopantetheinyl transferase
MHTATVRKGAAMMDPAMSPLPHTSILHGHGQAPGQWPKGPNEPQLSDGVLHVWRADLASEGDATLTLISNAERERAAAIHDERSGVMWARSRGVLRALLGRYLGVDAGTLSFEVGPRGKPSLAARDGAPAALSFNLSHSGELALYAVAPARLAVGVDVQVADRRVNAVAIARRMFGESAASSLQALEDDEAQREFLRLWVRHEAALKCSGVGLTGASEAAAQHARCWIEELHVGAGQWAAVAAPVAPREVRRWRWEPIG